MAEEKKFTPIKAIDAEGDVKEAFERTNEAWSNHPCQSLFNKYDEYIRWFEGDQYGYATGKKNSEWFDVSQFLDREVKNVYNRILPMIRQQHGDLIFDREFYALPATDESDDRRAAAVASIIIEQTNHDRAFALKMSEADLLRLIFGNCAWKEFWNKRLKGLAWSKSGAQRVGGDVDFAVVSPFNFRPDPLADSCREWRYVIEGKRVPVRSIDAEFGLDKGTIKGEGYTPLESSRFTRHGLDTPKEDSAIRKEYWEFASEERPAGRFMVIVNDMILWDGPNPTPEAERNYGWFGTGIPILGTQFDHSMVSIAQGPQRQINRQGSMIDEHFQNFRPKGMLPFGSLRPGDESAFKRMGGVDFIQFNPRVGTPYWQNPPPLPESSIIYSQMLESEFDSETSVRKPSYGQIPKYGTRASNSLFQSLKGADASVMQSGLVQTDAELTHLLRVRLSIAKKHYTEPRLIKNTGRGKMPAVRSFKGADLRDSTDVMVVPGIDIFTTRKKREDVAMQLVELKAIDARTALEIMRFKGIDSIVKQDKVDEYQCSRHIEQMVATKKYIPADPSDNHEFAYKFFNDYRKSEEYESLDRKEQGLIIQRLNEHKGYLMRMAPAPAAKPAAAPGASPLPADEAALAAAAAGGAAGPAVPVPGVGGVADAGGGGNGSAGAVPPAVLAAILAQPQGGE